MGIKDLWSILTPHADRKPIYELRGKKVAIDLAGWVCESLNVVDYFVHPRQHLKNLFFRTCYLIWEEVTPVFVLEGEAPKLKSQTIAKRNEIQFRGVRPRDKDKDKDIQPTQSSQSTQPKKDKGRTRFNHVLKQCENLLKAMGIQCVQGPGEAEAYCAFLNKYGLVDGVISQDSDCFAYGAVRVYRNFSVSMQGGQAAAGGAVDVYDMQQICQKMDFGQNKIIVMALLCGCDYCPEGIGGVGRDGVLKLFNRYKESEILERIRSWRAASDKYNALELRVDDKSICSYCGHIGRTQSHTKSGCGVCRTSRGCNELLWKEERLSLKAELALRKKALTDPSFPNEDIIAEFFKEPKKVPELNLNWMQPNIIKFIKQVGNLLQWSEIYCFQKFFPIVARWHVQNVHRLKDLGNAAVFLEPKEIIKKRTVKGVPSLEVVWCDTRGCLKGLIPDDQINEFEIEHPKGIEELYHTIEPISMLETAYPQMVAAYLKSKEKPQKAKKQKKVKNAVPLGSLENVQDLIEATNEIATSIKKPKRAKKQIAAKKGLQLIDKFLKPKANETPVRHQTRHQCSTPITKCVPSDLESDGDELDMSDIINGIISNPKAAPAIREHAGHRLHYDSIAHDLSQLLAQCSLKDDNELNQNTEVSISNRRNNQSHLDDGDLLAEKHKLSFSTPNAPNAKRYSLDDSFDLMVKGVKKYAARISSSSPIETPVERFKRQQKLKANVAHTPTVVEEKNVSYFFNQSANINSYNEDIFEQIMEISMAHKSNDLVVISDSE